MLNHIDGLLATGPAPDPHREERAAKLAALREKLHAEVRPALRAACRAHLALAKQAAVLRLLAADFATSGLSVPVPDPLPVDTGDPRELAREYYALGLLDADDPLLDGMAG